MKQNTSLACPRSKSSNQGTVFPSGAPSPSGINETREDALLGGFAILAAYRDGIGRHIAVHIHNAVSDERVGALER